MRARPRSGDGGQRPGTSPRRSSAASIACDWRFRDDDRDRLADIAHGVYGQHRVRREEEFATRRGSSAALRAGWSAPGCAGSGAARPLPRRRRSAPRARRARRAPPPHRSRRSPACACGDRTMQAWTWPGRLKSAAYRPRPVSSRASSRRGTDFPMPLRRQRLARTQKGHDPPPPPRTRSCSGGERSGFRDAAQSCIAPRLDAPLRRAGNAGVPRLGRNCPSKGVRTEPCRSRRCGAARGGALPSRNWRAPGAAARGCPT